ncbi:hypothetical protein AU381_00255 [Sinorhizobium glycinis]|uniref:Uncharacterized protein n=1 Tax=Sinorhizobium glycinis TaxID=1472378 RepID=A0A178Y071_9HYPH|nr:hypothetical protein [Sinorhizobium glycinis]OAP40393.1 hypothetical protein AU381_00255 [Sinorhizobium glycinis]
MTDDIARTAATQTQVLALELGLTDSAKKEIIQKHLVAMLAMERERCAVIGKEAALYSGCPADFIADEIAAAIRRGEQP